MVYEAGERCTAVEAACASTLDREIAENDKMPDFLKVRR